MASPFDTSSSNSEADLTLPRKRGVALTRSPLDLPPADTGPEKEDADVRAARVSAA